MIDLLKAIDLQIHGNEDKFTRSLDLLSDEGGVLVYKLTLQADEETEPMPFKVKWKLPSINVKGVWKTVALYDKRLQYNSELSHFKSRISVNAPAVLECKQGCDHEW